MEDGMTRKIVELAKNGDRGAIEHLYRLYSRPIRNLCMRMSASRTDAEDLTHEIFLRALEKIHTFRGESTFSTWLYRLGTNFVLMWIRGKSRMERPFGEVESLDEGIMEAAEPPSSRDSARTLVNRLSLQRALKRLPAGCLKVLVLHDIHGYKHREIAQLTGQSVGNSKSQLHRARRRLRRLLSTP